MAYWLVSIPSLFELRLFSEGRVWFSFESQIRFNFCLFYFPYLFFILFFYILFASVSVATEKNCEKARKGTDPGKVFFNRHNHRTISFFFVTNSNLKSESNSWRGGGKGAEGGGGSGSGSGGEWEGWGKSCQTLINDSRCSTVLVYRRRVKTPNKSRLFLAVVYATFDTNFFNK